MSYSAGLALWKTAFQLSPILFVDGIAKQITGSMLPIIAITDSINFLTGLLSGSENIEMDDFFAHFQPLPGSTLFELQLGTYPFANQAVAANATIQQPLQISMLMKCPARDELGYPVKLAVMTALQQVISQHAALGGTYTVCSPSFIYTNGILTRVVDASDQNSKQVQNAYQMDFTFPLLTLQQAQSVQNSLMSQLTSQTQTSSTPSWSGVSTTVGATNSLATPSFVPAAANLPGAVTSPFPGY